jgi:hypothetical protein
MVSSNLNVVVRWNRNAETWSDFDNRTQETGKITVAGGYEANRENLSGILEISFAFSGGC